MGQDEAERLYALALALVEEPEAAADLLLHSSGEHDLRAGAARWRRQQGLKPTPREVAPPQLDPAPGGGARGPAGSAHKEDPDLGAPEGAGPGGDDLA